MLHSLAGLLVLATVAHGFETFEIKCSGPSATVNFASSADKRGTIDILLSCLFTIIACTWTVQHLNVPEQREAQDPGWLGNIKWGLKRSWKSAKWMLFTVLAPEFLLAKNMADLAAVEVNIAKLQQFAAEDGVPWTRVHSMFANMGGFVVRVDVELTGRETGRALKPTGLAYSNPYHLVAADILAMRDAGFLEKLPSISEEELKDKSKSDGLVRIIAVVQIVWMVVQIIVRASKHLAISQLELSVLAFASCAIVIYGLNWEKPKGAQVPYTLLRYQGQIPQTVLRHVGQQEHGSAIITMMDASLTAMKGFGLDFNPKKRLPGGPIRNHGSQREGNGDIFVLMMFSVIFGAIHVAAWNFTFPNPVERTMWRVGSVLCTAAAFVCTGVSYTGRALDNVGMGFVLMDWIDYSLRGIWVLVCFAYVVARLFMIVEIFRSLFFLPPSAYIATWASNVPHIA